MESPSEPSTRFDKGELDWIEKTAIENLKARVATTDTLAKEAVTTLTVLLAGAGGAWAYAIKLLDERATYGTAAAGVAALWLTLLSMAVVWKCLKIKDVQAVYNVPGELLLRQKEGCSYEEWRVGELENIQKRIDLAIARNNQMADDLNLIRFAATLTPVLSAFAVAVFRWWV